MFVLFIPFYTCNAVQGTALFQRCAFDLHNGSGELCVATVATDPNCCTFGEPRRYLASQEQRINRYIYISDRLGKRLG